jgi:DNA-binding transcriptional MerR regulator
MKMERRKLRIKELAEHLAVDQSVIREWEKEFGIRSRRTENGQKFYTDREIRQFVEIKEKKLHQATGVLDVCAEVQAETPLPALVPHEEQIIASKVTQIDHERSPVVEALLGIRNQLALLSDLLRSC